MKLAIATTDGETINEHFGRAETMTVIETDETGAELSRETRPGMGGCACEGGHDSPEFTDFLASFDDCGYVLVKKIGPQIHRALAARGATVFELTGELRPALEKIAQYEQKRREKERQSKQKLEATK